MNSAITWRSRTPPALFAPAVFFALVLAMFGDLLLWPAGRVLSHSSTDLAMQFIPWRQFGFDELRRGNLALWNPHIFCGAPYFAGFQSALLYPPNWLHLILPGNVAINWIIALHVFLAGYFTYLWARGRGVSIAGAILAGAMFMFGGPYFLHVYAGHLPHLAVMVWPPLVLLALDKLSSQGRWRWYLLGAAAVAMQIFAGHPQYLYYTAITTALYAALLLVNSRQRAAVAIGFAAIYVGGAMLAAVQLLPGIDAQSESVRSGGTGFDFASTFSLPPANLLTLLAPNFFGWVPLSTTRELLAESYWGAGYLWEMSLFVSMAGLVLAVFGGVSARCPGKWILITMIAAALLLALGRHTPLYRPMLSFVPKYDSFRGTVKFAYIAVLFASVLAGVGFDEMLRRGKVARAWPIALASAAVLMLLIGWWITFTPAWWVRFVGQVGASANAARELFVRPPDSYQSAGQIHAARATAAKGLIIGGATLLSAAALLLAARWNHRAVYGVWLLAFVELFAYARSTRATMPFNFEFAPGASGKEQQIYAAWREAVATLPHDQRGFSAMSSLANASMSLKYNDVWGYDPGVLRRYAELWAVTQGRRASDASQYLPQPPRIVPSVLRMLRCSLVLWPDVSTPVRAVPHPLPMVSVISDWVQLGSAEATVAYVTQESFDPRRTVVLDSPPAFPTTPAADAPGTAEVLASGTDWLEIRAVMNRAGILLITNSFSRGWRALNHSSSPEARYQVVPANWALQAISLDPGTHHIRLEYRPAAFVAGKWITTASLLAWAGLVAVFFMRRRQRFR